MNTPTTHMHLDDAVSYAMGVLLDAREDTYDQLDIGRLMDAYAALQGARRSYPAARPLLEALDVLIGAYGPPDEA